MNLRPARPEQQRGQASPAAVVWLLVVLAVSWLVWSGIFKPLLLVLGVFSCLLSAYMASRMGFFRHQKLIRLLPRLPACWWWVFKDIVASSINVAKLILQPSMPISPTLIELDAQPQSESAQVILGNAITLSPGTVTIDVHKGKLLVHCLTQESARSLLDGEAVARSAKLEPS